MAQQVHDVSQVVVCLNNIGGAYVGLGEYDLAIQALEQVFALSKEKTFTDAESLTFLAEAYLGKDNLEKALARPGCCLFVHRRERKLRLEEMPGVCWEWLPRGWAAVSVDEQVLRDAPAC